MGSAPWWYGQKGEWYVVVQFVLFGVVVFAPQRLAGSQSWDGFAAAFAPWSGVLLILTGGLLAFWGFLALGRNLSPLPHPLDEAKFVKAGPYKIVRHPIYSGLILASFGWGLFVQGTLTLVYAAVLFAFFDLKTRREERYLVQKFPEYTAYRREIRKLIPFLY